MTEQQVVKNWILSQKNTLDEIIAKAAADYHSKHSLKRYYKFDADRTLSELYLLNRGQDLCYDRPSIGFSYSLWYHGKRVNGLIDFFIQLIVESKNDDRIEIFDLGAGTGALQWAVGIVLEGMVANGIDVPEIRIVNIDSSPFMLDYNINYLWKHFTNTYTNAKNINIDYQVNSWTNPDESEFNNVWLCASYLFDHSESQQLIAQVFNDLAQQYQPQKILLLSANSKSALVDSVGTLISASGYQNRGGSVSRELFTGYLPTVNQFRNSLKEEGFGFTGNAKWDIDTWYGKVLTLQQSRLGIAFPNRLAIYQTAERTRNQIRPTPEQIKASEDTKRPTIILGPAGCGKSVVLTGKIENIVKNNNYDIELNILLTTFNKDLVEYLGDWIESILDASRFTRSFDTDFKNEKSKYSYFTFKGSTHPNITVMHFDVLPTKVGGVIARDINTAGVYYDKYHRQMMKKAVDKCVKEFELDRKKYSSILDLDFLQEEHHRVFYGLQCRSINEYLSVSREGRGASPRLILNGQRRRYVAHCIKNYIDFLRADRCESFIIRRERFLKKLQKNEGGAGTYTHLLVDELQDCCKADYDIFYSLLKVNDNLTVTGDLAQAINIGTTARIPRPQNQQMSSFQKIQLAGSFRLPFRVSQCIKELSLNIKEKFSNSGNADVSEIIPYKGAPPGARPIFVQANTEEALASKISEIYHEYKHYDAERIQHISIFENSKSLKETISELGLSVSSNYVQKAKGMEMSFVVWDTNVSVDTQNEVNEFIYTALTRTTNILVLACTLRMSNKYFDIFKMLDQDRIIYWDEDSEKIFQSICKKTFPAETDEDEDDEELESIIPEEDEHI